MLCRRNKTAIKRNPLVFKARLGQTIILALVAAMIFSGSAGPTLEDMQNTAGAMFFMAIATFMPPYMMTNVTFQTERPVFLREQANKMYGVIPYYLAKLFSDVPGFLIVPTAFVAITYFAIGLTGDTV